MSSQCPFLYYSWAPAWLLSRSVGTSQSLWEWHSTTASAMGESYKRLKWLSAMIRRHHRRPQNRPAGMIMTISGMKIQRQTLWWSKFVPTLNQTQAVWSALLLRARDESIAELHASKTSRHAWMHPSTLQVIMRPADPWWDVRKACISSIPSFSRTPHNGPNSSFQTMPSMQHNWFPHSKQQATQMTCGCYCTSIPVTLAAVAFTISALPYRTFFTLHSACIIPWVWFVELPHTDTLWFVPHSHWPIGLLISTFHVALDLHMPHSKLPIVIVTQPKKLHRGSTCFTSRKLMYCWVNLHICAWC